MEEEARDQSWYAVTHIASHILGQSTLSLWEDPWRSASTVRTHFLPYCDEEPSQEVGASGGPGHLMLVVPYSLEAGTLLLAPPGHVPHPAAAKGASPT